MNETENDQAHSRTAETNGDRNDEIQPNRVSASWYGGAAALGLLAPLFVFLTGNGYALFAPETVAVYAIAVAIGVPIWVTALPRWRLPALIALAAIVAFAIGTLAQPESIWTGMAIAAGAAIAMLLLRDKAPQIIAIAAGVHIASTLGLGLINPYPGGEQHQSNDIGSTTTAEPPPPPLLHLILDEFPGPHGFPADIPGGPEVSRAVTDRLRESGFDVQSHAFAQYAQTSDSIPNEFNFSASSEHGHYLQGRAAEFSLTRNDYFTHLLKLGYTLDVYQSSYLDYCQTPGAPVRNCTTYASNSITAIADLDIDTSQKVRFILNSFLDSSNVFGHVGLVYRRINERIGNSLPRWREGNSRTGPLAVVATADRLRAALERLAPGEAHIAHLLMPHYPYVYDADCNVKPVISSWLNRGPFHQYEPLQEHNNAEARRLRYQQYFGQVNCSQNWLDDLVEAIQASGRWQDAIVIIQGDHGARISRHDVYATNAEKLTPDDFRDAYSAFFAVKGPNSQGRLLAKPQPLPALLAAEWSLPPPQIVYEQVFLQSYGSTELVATPLRGFEE